MLAKEQPAQGHRSVPSFLQSLGPSQRWTAPRHRPPTLERAALRSKLACVTQAPMAMVRAPAGYGKTTLLLQLHDELAASDSARAWISLNSSHRDLSTLYGTLAAAMASCGAGAVPPAPGAPLEKVFTLEAMHAHLDIIALSAGCEIFIFLDDAQVLAGSEALSLLALLVDRIPANVHLIVASRTRLQLPLGRLRQRQLLVALDARDLKLMSAEAEALLIEGATGETRNAGVACLAQRCEGWVGAVVLARQMLVREPDARRLLAQFSGASRPFAEFFREEVMANTAQARLREFMLQTSVLERLSPELCNAVTNASDSRELLGQCEANGSFLEPLDDQDVWYRFHPLFADYLQRELGDAQAALVPVLRQRACDWLVSNEHYLDAFEQAMGRDELILAAEILDAWCDREFGSSASNDIMTLSSRLPEEVKRRFPRIMLIEAWRRDVFWQFEGSRELLQMSRERLQQMVAEATENPENLAEMQGLLMHGEMMVALCTDQMPRTEELAQILIRDYERANVHVRGSFYSALLYAQREQYKLHDIDRLSRLSRSHCSRKGKGLTSVFVEAIVGPSHFMVGRSEVAIHCLEDGLDTAISITERGSSVAAVVALPLCEVLYERNELTRARALLDEYVQHASLHGLIDQMISAWLTQMKLLRQKGDIANAYKIVDMACAFAREHSFDRIRFWIVAGHVKMLLADGQIDEAARVCRNNGIVGAGKQFLPGGAVTTSDEARALAWVRVALAENRISEAMAVAKQWHSFLQSTGAVRNVIRWDIILAHGFMLSGERLAAQRALRRGVGSAVAGRFIRSFLDEGAWLEGLLQDQTVAGMPGDQPVDAFVAELLQLFAQQGDRSSIRVELPSDAGYGIYGALGTRELEILRLMGNGLLNREIGDKLGITEGSVKWYVQQIYDKVGVRRRAQVVERAYQLGLISK